MTEVLNTGELTVYCKKDASQILKKLIQRYIEYYGSVEKAEKQFGLSSRGSTSTPLNRWMYGKGPIPLKHLITVCNKTRYDIKSFLERNDTMIVGIHSHKIVPYANVDESLLDRKKRRNRPEAFYRYLKIIQLNPAILNEDLREKANLSHYRLKDFDDIAKEAGYVEIDEKIGKRRKLIRIRKVTVKGSKFLIEFPEYLKEKGIERLFDLS